MRLDASESTADWVVWHVPTNQQLFNVLWVDDTLALYCQRAFFDHAPPVAQVRQARCIRIEWAAKRVLIDPAPPVFDATAARFIERIARHREPAVRELRPQALEVDP